MGDLTVNSITSFDQQALLDKLGGDESFVRGLLAVALRSSAAMPVDLRAAADAGNLDLMMRLSHKVKGTAGDLCAVALHDQAAAVEMAARTAAAPASALTRALADAVDSLLDDLRRIAASGA